MAASSERRAVVEVEGVWRRDDSWGEPDKESVRATTRGHGAGRGEGYE